MFNFFMVAVGALMIDEEGTKLQNSLGAALMGVGLSRTLGEVTE